MQGSTALAHGMWPNNKPISRPEGIEKQIIPALWPVLVDTQFIDYSPPVELI